MPPRLPLPTLPDGRAPVISSGFGPRKGTPNHRGADITYRALPSDPPPKIKNGKVVYTATRTKNYYSPPGMAVLATEDGEVVQAKVKPGIGGDVWIHHVATGRVTRYAHLSKLGVKVGDRVQAGQPIGIWGAGHGTPFVHLHFELLTAGKKNSQEDPAPYLLGSEAGPTQNPSSAVASAATRFGGSSWLWLLLLGVLASSKS